MMQRKTHTPNVFDVINEFRISYDKHIPIEQEKTPKIFKFLKNNKTEIFSNIMSQESQFIEKKGPTKFIYLCRVQY